MGNKSKVVSDVIEYIENHLSEDLSQDRIAEAVGYSKFHLGRLFAECMGSTMYKYIQSRRLSEAAVKLADTNEAIAGIAYDAGYESQQAFTLAFKQLYFCTPMLYRKRAHSVSSNQIVSTFSGQVVMAA